MLKELLTGPFIAMAGALLLGAAAIFLHVRQRYKAALIVLTLAAITARIAACFLDPFLNMWDEVFHAVAARNMAEYPLTPMLHRESGMPITEHWPHQHIWLHKPPFFLWLMALSIKVFGTEIWAVRLPSALLTAALVPITWRIGTLLVDRRAGFTAAALIAFSYLLNELTAGAINTDHNDAVFIAMVTCSLWALLEYLDRGNWRWAITAGFFSATAILTKWHVGLLVFLSWGIIMLMRKIRSTDLGHFSLGLATTVIIAGAWIALILDRFPKEAAFEWEFKAKHFSHPMDGHSGDWTYHFEVISDLVPPFSWWSIVPAFMLLVYQVKSRAHRIVLLSVFLAVHGFFMMAQTKMVCYTMVLLPFYMIAVSNAVVYLIGRIRDGKFSNLIYGTGLFFLMIFALDPLRIAKRHTLPEELKAQLIWRHQYIAAIGPMEELAARLGDPERTAIFNFPSLHFLQFMFDHGHATWDKMPTAADAGRLLEKGFTVYALQDRRAMEEFPANVIVIPDSVIELPRFVGH